MKDIIAPIDSEDGLFHDGDPAGDVRGTVLYAQWLNAMQGAVIDIQTEHKHILAAAGMQPNPAQNSQLADAIKGLIAQARQENEKRSLLRKNNGADIPDKAAFVAHLGLKDTVEQAQNALDKRTGGVISGELTCNSSIRGRSFGCRAGVNGTHTGHQFNFNWTDAGQLEAWVDVTRVGGVTLYAINSDKGLKKDIRYRNDIDEAYREVKNWKVATYRYKERGIIPESCELLGFIANDLIEYSPECVHGKGLPEDYDVTADPNNPDAYYLDHTAMIAKLTHALHVTMGKVERLEREVKAQQAEIEALKTLMRSAPDVSGSPAQTQNMDNDGETP